MNYVKFVTIVISVTITTFGNAAEIEQLFDKGAQWQLTIDNWDGPMVVQDQRFTTHKSGHKVLTANVKWKSQRGQLEVRAEKGDPRRKVYLTIDLPNGEAIAAEGYLGWETDAFMAGETRGGGIRNYFGAWYATRASTSGANKIAIKNGVVMKTDQGVSKKTLDVSGGIVVPANTKTARPECRLRGGIGGMTEFVASGWLQPKESGLQPIEVPLDSNNHFDMKIPAGLYQFGLVPRGKLDLQGPGVSQEVNCPPGGNMRLSANVNSVSE